MPPRRSFVIGCLTSFLAGLAIAQTMGPVTAHSLAPVDPPEIRFEREAGGLVLRPTGLGKTYAVLVRSGPDSPARNEITFRRESLALDLKGGGSAVVFHLRSLMECTGNDCKPCKEDDACTVPPVPLVSPAPVPPPAGSFQMKFLLPGRP